MNISSAPQHTIRPEAEARDGLVNSGFRTAAIEVVGVDVSSILFGESELGHVGKNPRPPLAFERT
jgi:hypothetical protein